ncbi:recombinase family protein [Streptomyces europaeiscabiei]|uniref:recombinase family protein n=1 Tax=Streptomyces europaeiscabiei TaxID=146819 RepID=UPI002E2CDC9E|nr:recombinase family protein [Streptomyces europaeiscabiei]
MSTCAAPVGSPCRRTGKGKVAVQYRTARCRLVPQLAKALSVPTPAIRKPGSMWAELPRPVSADAEPVGHVRLGYARASTARQSLDAQLKLAGEIRSSGVAAALVVHEHKRLDRGIELAMLAEELKASDVGLEFLTGELKGSHDPSGIVFTVLAAMSGMEREHIRDRTLESHESAGKRGKRGKTIGGAGVTDEDMPSMALHLRDIAKRLVITAGAKRGQHPLLATVMRMLREHDERAATAASA